LGSFGDEGSSAAGQPGDGSRGKDSAERFEGTGPTLARPAVPARSAATREAPDDAWGGREERLWLEPNAGTERR